MIARDLAVSRCLIGHRRRRAGAALSSTFTAAGFALGSAGYAVGLESSLARKTLQPRVSADYRRRTRAPATRPRSRRSRPPTRLAGRPAARPRRVSGRVGRPTLAISSSIAGQRRACRCPRQAPLPPRDRPHRDRQRATRNSARRPCISCPGHPHPGPRLPGSAQSSRPPGQPHLRRPHRTAPLLIPGDHTRGAPRDATPPRGEGRRRRRGRLPGHTPASARLSQHSPPASTKATPPSTGPPGSSRTHPLKGCRPERGAIIPMAGHLATS